MAAVDAFKVRAIIEAGYDKTSLNRANADVQASYRKLSSKMKQVNAVARATQASVSIMGAAIVGSFAAGVAAAAAFEEQFVAVKKTLDVKGTASETERAFENISKRLRELVKLAPITTQTVNEIAAIGGQLGVAASQIVSFTDTVQKLTIATNLSAEQAALSMARLQEITGSSAQELDNLGSSLVALGNNFAAQESEIITAALQIATSTAQISGEMNNAAVDAMAFATALKAIGQPSQAGATAIVRLMSELSEAMAVGGANLKLFADVAGMAVPAFKELYELDSTQAVTLFIKGLEDTSKLGLTNITVLQKLGLGQVRTQKAILATSKASDTLVEAIRTANEGFIENSALTSEAERRYETLVSEITKGKNIVKGEFIDFGLDNNRLKKGTEAIRALNNALLSLVSGFRFVMDNIGMFTMGIGSSFIVFNAFRTSIRVAREELKLYQTAALAATKANERYNTSIQLTTLASGKMGYPIMGDMRARHRLGVFTNEQASRLPIRADLFPGMDDAAVQARMGEFQSQGFFSRGLRGNRSLSGGIFGGRAALQQQILDNPTLLSLIYGNKVPAALRPMLTQDPFFMADSSYLGFGTGSVAKEFEGMKGPVPMFMRGMARTGGRSIGVNPLSRISRGTSLLRLKAEEALLKRGAKLLPQGVPSGVFDPTGEFPAPPDLLKAGANQNVVEKALEENLKRQAFLQQLGGRTGLRIGPALKASPTKIAQATLREALAKEGLLDLKQFDAKNIFGKRGINMNLTGMLRSSEELTKQLNASRAALEAGNLEGGELAMAFDQLEQNAGKFATVVKGIAKAFLKMIAMAAPLIIAFKIFEKIGEQKRGVMEFSNAMANLAERTQELTVNTEKLQKAQKLLNETTDKGVAEILEPQVEELEKNLKKQREQMAQDIGASFIQDIMIANFGKGDDGVFSGTYIERLVKMSAGLRKTSEDIIMQQMGGAVGEAIISMLDPEAIRANAGQLPSLNDIVNSLLFADGAAGFEGDLTPSGFFEGKSGDIITQLMQDFKEGVERKGGKATGVDFIKDVLGFDPSELELNAMQEIVSDIVNFGDAMGIDADRVLKASALQDIKAGLQDIRKINKLTDQEFAELIVDVSSFLTATSGLTGENILEKSGFSQLKEGSPLAEATKKFLKGRLEDFIAAGVVTQKELNKAGDSYTKLMRLYQDAYSEFIETTDAANKAVMDELGITEQNLLRLAQKIDEAFKQARKSMVDLTSPLPEENKDFNPLQALLDAAEKANAQNQLEKIVRQFMNSGYGLVADELASLGVMGGALGIGQALMANPATAMALEQQLIRTGGSSYVDEVLGGNMVEETRQQSIMLGGFMADGLVEGISNSSGELAAAFIASMDFAVEEFKTKYGIKSPSLEMEQYGIDLVRGMVVGVDGEIISLSEAFDLDTSVVQGNIEAGLDEVVDALMQSGYFVNTGAAIGALISQGLGDGAEEFMINVAGVIQSELTDTIDNVQKAFDITTGLTAAKRAQVSADLAVDKAMQAYNIKLMQRNTLEEEYKNAVKERIKLEKEGIEGNITLTEKADLLRQEISINETKRKLAGDFTAAEQIAINEQERKVAEYERMLDLGVIDNLTLQAEKDTLRDLKGEFKTPEEKELFFVEAALAQEAFDQATEQALAYDTAIDQARIREQEAFNALQNYQPELVIAYNGIFAAQEGVVQSMINLDKANAEFVANAPKLQAELGIVKNLFGGLNDPITAIFDSVGDLNDMDLSGFRTELTKTLTELAKVNTYQKILDFTTDNEELVGGTGFMDQYLKSIGDAEGPGSRTAHFRNIVGVGTALDSFLNSKGGYGSNNTQNMESASGALTGFMGVLRRAGIETQRSADGIIYFDETAPGLTDAMTYQLMSLGFMPGSPTQFAMAKDSMNKAHKDAQDSYDPRTDTSDYKSDSEDYSGYDPSITGNTDLGGSGAPTSTYAGVYRGQNPGSLKLGSHYKVNQDIYDSLPFKEFTQPYMSAGAIRSYLGYDPETGVYNKLQASMLSAMIQSYMPGGLNYGSGFFSGTTFMGGMKMGGRIPDMSHLAPRKMYMGGRDNMMRRALVGEYGPEEVRFVPGSGFLVKPLTEGGRGNNTIVQNLSVNVTGVPSDPTSARKAAVEIRKALHRLDKEGTAGGGLTRR